MIINVAEYLLTTSQRYPDQVAVANNEEQCSFRELDAVSRQVATLLFQEAPGQGKPVAILLKKSATSVGAFAGVLYSGNFYVPLDPGSPIDRLRSILDDLQPLAVIVREEDADRLAPAVPDAARQLNVEQALRIEHIDNAQIAQRVAATIDTDPVYVKYTSGSTGKPKGVVLPHRAVIDYIEWAQDTYQLGPSDVIGNQAPFTFDVSVQDIYLSLKTGATLRLIPEHLFSFPAALLKEVSNARVSYFCWVPSVLVSISNLGLLADADTDNLRWVTVLGEVMPTPCFNDWAHHCRHATLVNTYGPTETAIASTYFVLNRQISDDEPLPIGKPCRNTAVWIVDNEGRVVEDSATGEICIRGSGLALGYWNAAEKTAAAFVPIAAHDHYRESMYRTGDLGYWNEHGELMFVGRRDSQIKHLGYRIELGEIETAAGSLPDVDRACVLYDAKGKAIVLFYEAAAELERGALRTALAAKVPKYMLPKTVYHVGAFPLNQNGKIDRKQLGKQFLS